jgi:REP element-mobilizing transposase RayT
VWNDTDIPLAYLITIRCYGTWLHGDERGSVDRFRNRYQTPRINPNDKWQRHNERQLKTEPVTLNAHQRKTVEDALREVCAFRSWRLHAVNARTNHVHAVVSAGSAKPERVLNDFKSYATRRMKEQGCWRFEHSPWVDKGSKRHLWNERSVALAVDYVVNGQGDDLPDFD